MRAGRRGSRQVCPQWRGSVRDLGDKTIAATWDVDYVPVAALTLTQHVPKRGHVDFQISFLNENVRPYPRDQIFFADNLTCAFNQARQDLKCASTDPDRLIGLA